MTGVLQLCSKQQTVRIGSASGWPSVKPLADLIPDGTESGRRFSDTGGPCGVVANDGPLRR